MPPTELLLTHLSYNRTSPKWSFRGRTETIARSSTPGPGTYTQKQSVDTDLSNPLTSKSSRDTSRAKSAPGPGDYAPQAMSSSPRYRFGTSDRSRSGLRHFWQPLQHKAKDEAGIKESVTPGPGAYSPDSILTRRSAAKWSVQSRGNTRDTSGTPGPGNYQVAKKQPIHVHNPEWQFTKDVARSQRKSDGPPGPGTYGSSNLGKGPAFSMRQRFTEPPACGGPQSGPFTQFGY